MSCVVKAVRSESEVPVGESIQRRVELANCMVGWLERPGSITISELQRVASSVGEIATLLFAASEENVANVSVFFKNREICCLLFLELLENSKGSVCVHSSTFEKTVEKIIQVGNRHFIQALEGAISAYTQEEEMGGAILHGTPYRDDKSYSMSPRHMANVVKQMIVDGPYAHLVKGYIQAHELCAEFLPHIDVETEIKMSRDIYPLVSATSIMDDDGGFAKQVVVKVREGSSAKINELADKVVGLFNVGGKDAPDSFEERVLHLLSVVWRPDCTYDFNEECESFRNEFTSLYSPMSAEEDPARFDQIV
jgi:hypothetical protein